ncbi:MAG: amidase domain-containing protein [Eubacteriales bacterium]|nr:amidase domain-containing protein [Eubacteriales bacterium]
MKTKSIIMLAGCIISMMILSLGSVNVFAANELSTTETIVVELDVPISSESYKEDENIFRNMDGFSIYDEKKSVAVFQIRMPKTFEVTKETAKSYGENVFSEKLTLLCSEKLYSGDLDDIVFQSFIKEYAINDYEYVDLAKFIDIYENYEYNDKMNGLITRIEQEHYSSAKELLSDENFVVLLAMMPIDSNLYTDTEESDIKTSTPSVTSLSGYNGTNAKTYAQTWAYKTNNTSYGYYANYFNHPSPSNNNMWSGGTGNDRRTWNDCADFVSQCLLAGGASTIKSGLLPSQNSSNWYYSNSKPSNTWGGASNFQQHWTARVGVRSTSSAAKVGDPASLDLGGDDIADHTVIITSVNGSSSNQILYACHTIDQFEESGKSFATLYSNYQKIWIYAVAP